MAAAGVEAKPLFEPLTNAGFAWFTINYRLLPAYHFPAPLEDVENAIRHVQSHAAEYKVDLKRIAIAGESAGGHLASFVGARDGAKLKLRAVVPFYAPNDLEAMVAGPDSTTPSRTPRQYAGRARRHPSPTSRKECRRFC